MTIDEAMTIQIEASDRLHRARRDHAAAQRWCDTIVPDAPLRTKLADRRRLDAAIAELAAAPTAYEAVQDIECPQT